MPVNLESHQVPTSFACFAKNWLFPENIFSEVIFQENDNIFWRSVKT